MQKRQSKGLQNLGFNYGKPILAGVCAICERTLTIKATRISPLEVVDLYYCDHCGRTYMEGALGLLVQVGRREKCTDARSVVRSVHTFF